MNDAAPSLPAKRRLERLLQPNSIAIIGASEEPSRIGGRPLAYLLAAGYRGAIYPVNPKQHGSGSAGLSVHR